METAGEQIEACRRAGLNRTADFLRNQLEEEVYGSPADSTVSDLVRKIEAERESGDTARANQLVEELLHHVGQYDSQAFADMFASGRGRRI